MQKALRIQGFRNQICENLCQSVAKNLSLAPVLLHEIANTTRLLKSSSRLIETWPKVHIVATLNGVLSECYAIRHHFAESRLDLNASRDQFFKPMSLSGRRSCAINQAFNTFSA